MATRFAFIGFGEAGRLVSTGLLGAGAGPIRAYDILFPSNVEGPRLRAAAEAAGVAVAADHGDAVRGAEVVVSTVTSKQAVVAARQAAPHLAPGQVYLDFNSCSPMLKRAAAEAVEASGAHFVEAAVMANVPGHGHKVPMLLAGEKAADLAALLTPLGMRVEAIGTRIGEASAIKMYRSVVMKGLDALFVECLTAAEAAGVSERVLASLNESMPGLDWEKLAGYHLSRVALHAKRRADEMDEVAETLEEAGFAPTMACAIAEVLRRCADSGVKERMGETPPEDYRAFVRALRGAAEA